MVLICFNSVEDPSGGLDGSAQSIEELFTIFDEIRKTSFNMSDVIYDLIGKQTYLVFVSYFVSTYNRGKIIPAVCNFIGKQRC